MDVLRQKHVRPGSAAPIAKKLDLAENTRYCQAGFEDAMPDVTRRFLADVTWRYAPVRATWSSAAIVLRFHTDRNLWPYAVRTEAWYFIVTGTRISFPKYGIPATTD